MELEIQTGGLPSGQLQAGGLAGQQENFNRSFSRYSTGKWKIKIVMEWKSSSQPSQKVFRR